MKKDKKLTWFLTSRGFGSEINNLLYAINYCKKNDYSLVLDTTFWNYNYKDGWTDYFIALQSNDAQALKHKILVKTLQFISRFVSVSKLAISRRKLVFLLLNFSLKKDTETIFEGFHKVREFNNHQRLQNKDEFISSINRILKNIWKIKPEILSDIKNAKISIDHDYAVFHIRRGDKIKTGEDNFYPVEDYMNKLKSINSSIKTVFVMSDDFSVYTELKNKFLDYEFITLISDSKKGYKNSDFNQMKKSQKKVEIINLLTEIEIARESKIFIGSFRSNLYRLIEYYKLENCYNIGFKNDQDPNIYL